MRTTRSAGLCGLLVLAVASTAGAQQFTGGLRGAVRDANGVVPGVTVTLTNEGTAISRETTTNEQGQYTFSAVTPGTYSVKAEVPGFKTYQNQGIRIGTQTFITLDILLEVGQLEETITVTGQSPLIETSNASVGESLGRDLLDNLPAPGRAAFLVAVTVPTVNPVGDPQFNRQQDQTNASRISLGGGGVRANNYLVDGVPIGLDLLVVALEVALVGVDLELETLAAVRVRRHAELVGLLEHAAQAVHDRRQLVGLDLHGL